MNPTHKLTLLLLWNENTMSSLDRKIKDQDLDLALSSNIAEMLDDFIIAGKMVIQHNPKLAQEVGYEGIEVLIDDQLAMKTGGTEPIELVEMPRRLEMYQMAMGRALDNLTKIRLGMMKRLGDRKKW